MPPIETLADPIVKLLMIEGRLILTLAILAVGLYILTRYTKRKRGLSAHATRITFITLAAIALCHITACSGIFNTVFARAELATLVDKSGYKLVFQDEFNGTSLDTSKWNTQFYWGRTHDTHYMTYFAPDAFEVSKGKLRIKAEKRQVSGLQYTGGIITTYEKLGWQYGYFEMKAKLPKGKGLWPAFWLGANSKDWPPEIDIFEVLGHQPNTIYLNNIWKDASGKPKSNLKSYVGVDFSKDYHVFAVKWTPTEIIWYIDNIEKRRVNEGISQVPMCLLAALTIGGDWPGPPDNTTPFPAYMDVDFIRVFKKK